VVTRRDRLPLLIGTEDNELKTVTGDLSSPELLEEIA